MNTKQVKQPSDKQRIQRVLAWAKFKAANLNPALTDNDKAELINRIIKVYPRISCKLMLELNKVVSYQQEINKIKQLQLDKLTVITKLIKEYEDGQ